MECREEALPGQSHCRAHMPKSGWANYIKRDPERAALYRSGGWAVARRRHLAENPTCVVCGEPARIVDHIVGRAEGGADLDPANLESLCRSHHAQKTQAESHRGRKRSAARRKEPR